MTAKTLLMASTGLLLAFAPMSFAQESGTASSQLQKGQQAGTGPVAPPKLTGDLTGDYEVLQPLAAKPGKVKVPEYGEIFYVPSTLNTVRWGHLPNRDAKPVLTVPSGSIVMFDTISHEGVLEDQGRDPARYFGQFGVPPEAVLDDAKQLTASDMEHDFAASGPHVITGPVAIEGAQPGDVLLVETLSLKPRVPYGVISNRHGKGALAGEFPETAAPDPAASASQPELYRNVSIFVPTVRFHNQWYAVMHNEKSEEVVFPVHPFMGTMGIAPNTSDIVNSVPPDAHGGNLDVGELGIGSKLYLPIQVPGGLFYTGDSHNSQGDGEVALTALEQSMRATFRLTILKPGDPRIPSEDPLTRPFGETDEYWIPIGLDPDMDEAVKDAVRQAIAFLNEKLDMDRATAYAYMSAATDYAVSQVVDRTKGAHALIRKDDFAGTTAVRVPLDPPNEGAGDPE